MRESSLWKWLQGAERQLGFSPNLHWRRVENLVAEGDPDVEGCYLGGAFNIELKVADRPARMTTRVLGPADIRPKQIPWARARWDAGGSSFFLIQVGSSAKAKRYMIKGCNADRIVGATEAYLDELSVIHHLDDQGTIVRRAASYRTPSFPST